MRIGLFAHRLAQTDATGVGRYVRQVTMALAASTAGEFDVVLASAPEPNTPEWVPANVKLGVVDWPRRVVHAAWCAGGGPRVERGLGALDVFHLLYPFPPARSAAPQVVTVHDVMPFDHPEWYPRSERLVYHQTLRLAIRRARRLVVPSGYVAERLAATLEVEQDLIAVVPHGVSGTFASETSSAEISATCAQFGVEPGRFAVCVGHVSTRKNLIPVIRAMSGLSADRFTLLIVGPDGHGAAATETEIARIGERSRVRRTGYLSDHDVAALVKGAALLVHPALEEGFGLVPLEAMAAGTPVLAAGGSSIPEVVGDAAVLVDEPREPDAWREALGALFEDDERRLALADAGRRRASMFSWSLAAARLLELYRDVTRG